MLSLRRRAAAVQPSSSRHLQRRLSVSPSAGPRHHESFFYPSRHRRLPLFRAGARARMMSSCLEHHAFITRTGLSAKPNVVNTLRKADWQRASIMLSNLQQTKEALLRKICFYILEHCAEAPGPLFAMEMLDIVEKKAIDIGKGNYRSVTRALTEGGYCNERMVVLAGEGTDHPRVSSKRRCQSKRLDISVPAFNGVEDLKLVSDYDLPSSFQGKMGTEEYLVDAKPEPFQVETQSSKT